MCFEREFLHQHTDVAREDQEVIVSQAAVNLGIDECLDINSIALRILVLENLEGCGVRQNVGGSAGHVVAVQDSHCGEESAKSASQKPRIEKEELDETDHSSREELWPGSHSGLFPRERKAGDDGENLSGGIFAAHRPSWSREEGTASGASNV